MLNDWLTVKVIHQSRITEAPKKTRNVRETVAKPVKRGVEIVATLLS